MQRYQARGNVSVAGTLMEVWTVRELPPTTEVAELALAGLLVPEAPDGSFPDPVVTARRCCGG